MRLTEAEGKQLLANVGISIPNNILILQNTTADEITRLLQKSGLQFPVYLKAQVLHGNRELQGLVKKAENLEEAVTIIDSLLPTADVLVEQSIDFTQTYYLSISYNTRLRQLVVNWSNQGGTGMDDRGDTLYQLPISILEPLTDFAPLPAASDIISQAVECFLRNDAVLLEINPLVQTSSGWVALDAKIELESMAAFRHPEWEAYSERSDMGRPPTPTELAAQAVSRTDQRGVAGESFFEFPGGTIGVMASGGGASTIAMDALLAEGLKPANYTEYSGNPTREKVAALTKVVTSLPNLQALYVVGSNANFTDIYETLAGLLDSFLESPYAHQPGFVVVIRRGGPRWQEAFAMVEERVKDLPCKVKLFGPDFPLVQTAAELKKELSQDTYAN